VPAGPKEVAPASTANASRLSPSLLDERVQVGAIDTHNRAALLTLTEPDHR
jgi:hypothetical protein